MPMSAFVGIVLLTLLHVIGARYIYSYVPYKEWCTAIGIVDADFFQDPRCFRFSSIYAGTFSTKNH